jgi:protein involved in polysaccharide export with SLBB domain
MNFFSNPPNSSRWPDVPPSIPRLWLIRILNFKAAGLMGLVLLTMAGSSYAADPLIKDPMNMTNLSSGVASTTNTPAAALINDMDALDDKYKLAIGDRLSFRVVEDEEDPRSLIVTDSGDLETPYIGRFPAVGKTCKELARDLKVQFEKEYYYQATVIVAVDLKARSLGRVYLVGQVRAAGPEEIPSDEVFTLSKAVLRAGGFTDFADQRHVRVTRKGDKATDQKQTFVVDVSRIFDKGKIEDDLRLESGDLISVPERMIRF